MQGKALVLSGGGAKGAYEAGVFKAIYEKHIHREIKMVAGTSAGSLNAVLFAQGDLEETLSVWSTIKNSQILTANNLCKETLHELSKDEKAKLCTHLMKEMHMPFSNQSWAAKLAARGYQQLLAYFLSKIENPLTFSLAQTLLPCFLNILYELKQTQDFTKAITRTIYIMHKMISDGLFSQDGLKSIIDEHYHSDQLLHSLVLANATAYNLSKLKPEHFDFVKANEAIHADILLASSAIPFIFDSVHIHNDTFIDGGIPLVGDNTPIDVVYNKGYRDIIAIVLNADKVDVQKYEGANITIVQPQTSLGSALSSLNFNEDYTKKLIQLGYEDGLRLLS